MKIGTEKQLLVDDRIVEDTWNLKRAVMRPAKDFRNPLIVADRPWEGDGVQCNSMIFDEQENLFKLWYNVFHYVVWKSEKENWYTYWICYATSEDGITWEKPELGLFEFKGSKENNIVMQGNWWATCGTVLKEPGEGDPEKRYKLLYTDVFNISLEQVVRDEGIAGDWPGRPGVCIAYSPDGMRWKPYSGNPVIEGESDTANTLFLDDRIGKYVLYMRPPVYAGYWKRRIARAESKDLLEWSYPETVLVPDELDPVELYGMPVFKSGGYYFGLLQVYHSNVNMTIDNQLAFSRDGKRWDRLPARDIFLDRGLKHGRGSEFDAGMVFATIPIVVGDEMWFYYTGHNAVHDAPKSETAIGLSTLKLDRLIGRETAPGRTGMLLTRPFTCEGNELRINASSSNGRIQAELLTENGVVQEGYDRDSSRIFSGDSLDFQMSWKGNKNMRELRQRHIRLKLYMSDATLYSFQVVDLPAE